MTSNTEKLEKLLSEATGGKWHYSTCYGVAFIEGINKESVAHAVEYLSPKNDAELICALRNSAPLLLEIVKKTDSLIDKTFELTARALLIQEIRELIKKFEESEL